MPECPKGQRDRVISNGSAAGKPKKRCQPCGDQFTRTTPRGKPLKTKSNAVRVYLSGLSMNRIAFLLRVSAQAVLHWIRAFAREHDQKLELDEMWHYLKKKRLLAAFGEAGAARYAVLRSGDDIHLSHLAMGSLTPQLATCRSDAKPCTLSQPS
jgi:transposase-like protein